jgi:sensor domain CHASE-containing protein
MEIFRAFLFSLAIFAGLAIIAVLVAFIMKIIYSIVHRTEKKIDAKPADSETAGRTV